MSFKEEGEAFKFIFEIGFYFEENLKMTLCLNGIDFHQDSGNFSKPSPTQLTSKTSKYNPFEFQK